jgi:hypothetical protein
VQEDSCKVSRYFLSCFNVNPEFARNFKFMKSRGGDEFKILYMEAAFNKETGSGEFFMEFADKVRENKLVGSFKSQGAGQVVPVTFPHNDGDSSAVDALLRILAQQDETGYSYTRGVLPDTLKNKIEAKKKAAAQQALLSSREFDEKTAAALKASLDGHTVKLELLEDGMHAIGDCMESQKVKLEAMEGGMEFQKVKLEAMEGGIVSQKVDIVDIKQGVCNVIPDYQNEIRNLKEALAHKTKLCDRIEGQKGRLTMEINRLKWEVTEKSEENESLNKEKQVMSKKIQDMHMQLDMCQSIALLKQMQEETQRTAEILSSTLAEERAGKRPREA